MVATGTQYGAGIGGRGHIMLVTGVDRGTHGHGRMIPEKRADAEVTRRQTIISSCSLLAATWRCSSASRPNESAVTFLARIHIDLPDRFGFSTTITIYDQHINYRNHLENSALGTLVSEARVRFFKSLGYTELDVEGAGIIVTDSAIQYRAEAFHGEVLIIEMTPAEFNKYGFDLVYRVGEQASGREVARGKIGIMFFDYAARKPMAVPAAFRQRFPE
jgi:4-hydroxybenzoyl-CoA thioesterase